MAGLLAGREAGWARPLFFFFRGLAVFGQQLLLKRIKNKSKKFRGLGPYWDLLAGCHLIHGCWLAMCSADLLAGLTAHCLLWMGTYLFDPLGESTGGLAAWLWLAGRKQTYFSFRGYFFV